MEVKVGTDAQQGDGAQRVVDQLSELGLQVSLPVPEDLEEKGKKGEGETLESQVGCKVTEHPIPNPLLF